LRLKYNGTELIYNADQLKELIQADLHIQTGAYQMSTDFNDLIYIEDFL